MPAGIVGSSSTRPCPRAAAERDLKLLVPDTYFGAYPAACKFMGTGCDQFVVFYTEFGQHYANNDGFEEWGVAIYNVVSGFKWYDSNADGIWQQGEPPLVGWRSAPGAVYGARWAIRSAS